MAKPYETRASAVSDLQARAKRGDVAAAEILRLITVAPAPTRKKTDALAKERRVDVPMFIDDDAE